MRLTTSKLALIALCLGTAACSAKDDDDAATTTEGTTTTGGGTTTTTTTSATASLTTPSAVMGAIGDALGSAPAGTILLSGTSLNLASSASGDSSCTEHGEPLKAGITKTKGDTISDSDRLDQSSSDYPAKLFFCLATLSADKGASVETLLGSLAQVRSVFCSFEKTLGTFEYTTAGNDLLGGTPKDVPLTTECWPQGSPEGITSVTMDSATATLLDAATGYEKELKFSSASAGVDYRLRFFNKDGVIGFKKIEKGTSPAVGGYSEFVLDSSTGVILVNTVDDRGGAGGADSAYRRVVRMKVKGTMASLKFTALESMQGIRANSGNYETSPDSFGGATINGDKTKGFYGQSINFDGTAISSGGFAGCTGANASCTATGLLFDATNGPTFYGSRTSWATHRDSGLPPCDDGKDLTFAATTATGAFGKCSQ